jgi:hypothetical protein
MSNPNSQSAPKLTRTQRRLRVLELTQEGYTTRQIGAQLGVSHTLAWRDLKHSLTEYSERESVETTQLRNLEKARLDQLQSAVYPKALEGQVTAVEAVLSIMKRRAALLGLDQPVRVDLSAEVAFHIEEALNVLEQVLPKEHYKRALEALAHAA